MRGYIYYYALLGFLGCSQKLENNEAVFEQVDASEIGIDFRNNLSYTEDFNVYLYKSFYNGAGVGIGDINNDGFEDIFFCGNQVDNKLYLNQGDFTFRDITDRVDIASSGVWSNGVSIIDINGDGRLDIYVCKGGKPEGENRHNELFINLGTDREGIPQFQESAKAYGLDDLGLSVHAAFFDMDRDNDLDVYLLNNSIYPSEIVIEPKLDLRNTRDPGGGNKLYRNDGNKFTDISEQAGIYGSAIGFGLGVCIGDVNRDGWQDIYVANDFFEKDYLYINNQDGTFTESINETITESSQGAMGVDIADINNDGFPDIYVTEMLPKGDKRSKTKVLFDSWDMYSFKRSMGYHQQFPRNTLQLNTGYYDARNRTLFSEISRLSGTEATDWSWGVVLVDLDNDTHKEIYVTNGIFKDLIDLDYLTFHANSREMKSTFREKGSIITDLIELMPSVPVSNHLYTQTEDMVYNEVSKKWGTYQPGFSNGVAYSDLDNDGDLDIIVNNINMSPFIYRNNTSQISDNRYLSIALKGMGRNVHAVGAQVTLFADDMKLFQELLPFRGSMSTVTNRLHFGLGSMDKIDSIEIIWPDGFVQYEYDVGVNQVLEIEKTKDSVLTLSRKKEPSRSQLLSEVSEELGFAWAHVENEFNDFGRDILLPQMITNEGPKIAIGNANEDGVQDIYFCGAKGQPGALYLSDVHGGFTSSSFDIFNSHQDSEDTDAHFVDIDHDGDEDLLIAHGGYEFSGSSFGLANWIYVNNGRGEFHEKDVKILGNDLSVTSCLSVADYDNDGDKDVFVGNRVKALSYGIEGKSLLLENDGNGNFKNVTDRIATDFVNLGMVTDAEWYDYDHDGRKDLFICGDWMQIKVFKNEVSGFTDYSDSLGFLRTNGFWNTISFADPDRDGDFDLIAGNMGTNTILRTGNNNPVTLHTSDFNLDGNLDHIISVPEGNQSYPIAPWREITQQLPYLKEKYPTHNSYKEKTISELFSADQMTHARRREVYETASMVFWNQNGYFSGERLPRICQLAPIYSIVSFDMDDDDTNELFFGGNQSRSKPQLGSYMASYGSVIRFNGHGFDSVPPEESGFFVRGEIRDMQKIVVQNEVYLLVARNNNSVKVFTKKEDADK
ncbi:MAG: VCBS repeat-containing protein [Cytophagales bacterium]|nr:VCBS repeat-containing protein [Cytophagales bacterium]